MLNYDMYEPDVFEKAEKEDTYILKKYGSMNNFYNRINDDNDDDNDNEDNRNLFNKKGELRVKTVLG